MAYQAGMMLRVFERSQKEQFPFDTKFADIKAITTSEQSTKLNAHELSQYKKIAFADVF